MIFRTLAAPQATGRRTTYAAISLWPIALVYLASCLSGSAQTPNAPAASSTTVPEKPEKNDTVNAALPPGYTIGAGDVLQVDVWKEPEASVQAAVVRPDGKVSLPLVKEIDAQGLTPAQFEKSLTAKLDHFIHGADVTVVVKAINSRKVYLVGAVTKVGPIPLLYDMTVLQVLAEAGGLTEYAKKKKIYVLRTENGKQVKLPFDYNAVIKGEHVEQNVQVLPNDTIVIPH